MSIEINKSNDVWAEFSTLPQPSIILHRYDHRKIRFYWYQVPEDGKMITKTAIGVTSLLGIVMPTSPFLTQWKLDRSDSWEDDLNAASEYGTMLHILYGEWLTKRSIPKELIEAARDIAVRNDMGADMVDKDILAFLAFVEQYSIKPMLIEAMLLSEPINGESFAMTLDLLCELEIDETRIETTEDGVYKSGERKGQPKIVETKVVEKVKKIAIVDFKSNTGGKSQKQFYLSHAYQLYAAKKAVEFTYPEIKEDMILNFSPNNWKTIPSFSLKEWNLSDKEIQKFDLYIQLAQLDGLLSPNGSKFIPPSEFVEGVKSSDYKFLDYISFVNEILIPGQQTTVDELTEDELDSTAYINQYEDCKT
jgi:hypothetical protein